MKRLIAILVVLFAFAHSRAEQLPIRTYTTADGLPHRVVYDLLITRNGEYWAATTAGLAHFDPFASSPGAVSVGDANGTAAMISLRGQSTCCGPSTGFADFKVFQNGSFVATGNLGIGVSPKQGPGYRILRA